MGNDVFGNMGLASQQQMNQALAQDQNHWSDYVSNYYTSSTGVATTYTYTINASDFGDTIIAAPARRAPEKESGHADLKWLDQRVNEMRVKL